MADIFRTILCICIVFVACGAESLVFPPYLHSYGIRKATPKHLFMFFGPRTKFDDPQGIATVKMASRDDPASKDDDDEVVVYGVNSGQDQLIYNTSMYGLSMFGKKGSGKGQFLHPQGVAADVAGNVYVVDQGNNRIVHLFNPKKDVIWQKFFNGESSVDPGLSGPSQVALDARGNVYVTDTGNRRIVVFDSTGKIILTIPKNGNLFVNGPTTIAVADGKDKYCFFKNDAFLFCADSGGQRLWKIGFDGTVINYQNIPGGHHANYAALDFYHSVWITDTYDHCIIKLDHNGALLDIFGSHGTGNNQFEEPRGISIWKRYGQTFIAEKSGAQYFWMGTAIKNHSIKKTDNNHYSLYVETTDYSYMSVCSITGKDTTFFIKRNFIHPLGDAIIFGGGKTALPGKSQRLFFLLEPTYSSYTYNTWAFPIVLP